MRPVSMMTIAALFLFATACSSEPDVTASDEGAVNAASKIKSAAFDCKTTGDFFAEGPHAFKLALSGLDGDSDSLVWAADGNVAHADKMLRSIEVSPELSPLATLNENPIMRFEKDNLRLWGDSAGLEFVTVILYKDSGFRAGYVRVEDGGGGRGDGYSNVSCSVTELPPAAKQ